MNKASLQLTYKVRNTVFSLKVDSELVCFKLLFITLSQQILQGVVNIRSKRGRYTRDTLASFSNDVISLLHFAMFGYKNFCPKNDP